MHCLLPSQWRSGWILAEKPSCFYFQGMAGRESDGVGTLD